MPRPPRRRPRPPPLPRLSAALLCLAGLALGGSEAPQPHFRSLPTTVKTFANDTVLLPCYVEELGASVVRWWRGSELLAESSPSSTPTPPPPPPRVRLWPNHTLEVRAVRADDTGEYVCQVARPPPWGPLHQVHAIEVLSPAEATPVPASGRVEVELGQEVEMACAVAGVPLPLVTWYFQGEELPLLERRARLRFVAERRGLSGQYICSASNGVGPPATAALHLSVLYAPEVSTERPWVHSAPGLRAELSCSVSADPPAQVVWLKDGEEVAGDARVATLSRHDRHSLLFRRVVKADFGHYTCQASNRIGSGHQLIHLSGAPHAPSLRAASALSTDASDPASSSVTLVWEVESLSPVVEYELLFRRCGGGGGWARVVVPADGGAAGAGPLHSKAFELAGLSPEQPYEALVLARSRFGWSKPSPALRFQRRAQGSDDNGTATEAISQSETDLFPAQVAAILDEAAAGAAAASGAGASGGSTVTPPLLPPLLPLLSASIAFVSSIGRLRPCH